MSKHTSGLAGRHGQILSGLDISQPADGTSGNDTLKGTNGDDSIDGAGGDDLIKAKGGNDTLIGGAGDDNIYVTDLGGTDNIDGGKGFDVLHVKQAVDIDFSVSSVSLSGIEQIVLGKHADSVILTDGADAGVKSLEIDGGKGGDTLDGSAVTNIRLDLEGGAGNDVLSSGAKADVLNGGAGSDTINVTRTTINGDAIDGGGGKDTLMVSGGGNVNLNNATISNIELVQVSADATNLQLNNSGMTVDAGSNASTVIFGGGGIDNVTLGTAGQSVFVGSGDVVHATAETLFDGVSASVLMGSDSTLALKGGGDIDSSNFTMQGFSGLVLDGNHYNIDLSSYDGEYVNVTMGAGNSSLVTGEGTYAINGGGNGNTVDMSDASWGSSFLSVGTGVDTITVDLYGNQTVLTGSGDDTVIGMFSGFGEATASGVYNGGAGNDTLQLIGLGECNGLVMNANITGFETVDLSHSLGGVVLFTNTQTFTVVGSDYDDAFIIGNGHQTIDGGLGNDSVSIQAGLVSTAFGYDGGEGGDSLNIYTGEGIAGPSKLAPSDNTVVNLGDGVVNVECININASESGGSIELHLSNQSDVNVNSEGYGNAVYAGTGSDISIYFDEGVNYANLESASNVSVQAEYGDTTVVLGSGSNFDIELDGNNNTVVISDPTQFDSFGEGSHNTIHGGEGEGDTLEFSGAGTYNLHDVDVSGFEDVVIDNGVAVTLTLDDNGYDVQMGDQAATSVTGGEGADTFHFGASGQSAAGGGGDDTYYVSAAEFGSVTITEAAEAGNDTVVITGGGSFSLDAGVANVENYNLDSASVVTVNLDSETNPSGYTLNGSSGDDTFIITGGTGEESNSPQLFSGVNLHGGEGTDTIEVAGGGVVDLTGEANVDGVEKIVLDLATNLTAGNDGFDITGSAGVDTITSGSGADVVNGGAGIDQISTGAGNDTVTIDVNAPDVVDAGSDSDTAVLVGAAGISGVAVDLSSGGDQFAGLGGNQSGFENLDASALTGSGVSVTAGANTTSIIGSNQVDLFVFGAGDVSGVSLAGGGGIDTARFTGSNDLTAATVSGVEVLQLDGASTSLTVNSTVLAGVTNINDAGANDASQSLVLGNSVDLSAVTVANIETINVGNNVLTIDQSKISGLTAITGAGSGTLNVSTGNLDLTSIALTGVNGINLANGSNMTAQSTDLAAVTVINGAAGSETLTILDNANISGIQLNNLETLQLGASGVALTINQAHLGAVSAITGGAGADSVTATGNLDLTNIALTAVETISLSGSGSVLTANAADLAAVSAINGAAGSETVVLLDSTDLTGITFSAVEAISYGANALNVTIDQSKLVGVTSITGSGAAGDSLTMKASTGLDLTGSLSISGIETLNLGGGNATLAIDGQADLAGVTAINGGAGVDHIDVATGDLNLSAIAVTGVEAIHTSSTPGANLTVNAADIASLTTLNMGGTSDILTLVNADSALNLSAVTLTGVESIVLGNNADTTANTLTVANQLNGSGGTLNVLGSLAVSDTVSMTDAGTKLDFNTINANSIEHIVLGDASDASANTLDLNTSSAASITSIIGGGATAQDSIVLHGGGAFNFSTMGVSNVASVDTGDAAVTLTLNGGGYDVTVEANTGNTITSGAGSDVFDFSGNFAGQSQTINNFIQGSGGDVLDLSDIGVTSYAGEFSTASTASAALVAHGAAYSLADHTLYVDIDGTAGYNAATDLAIHLAGVNDLTAGTDLIV